MSAPTSAGNLASLFPVVTPAPAAPTAPASPGTGNAQPGSAGANARAHTALSADTGVVGTGQGRLIVLLLTLAAGIAAFGLWFAVWRPARRMAGSLGRGRGHHAR